MNIFDTLNHICNGGAPSPNGRPLVDHLEDTLRVERRLKQAYRAALIEVCNGDVDLARTLAQKNLD